MKNTTTKLFPTPAELAKKDTESTTTLSLRIKMKTLTAFEKYATMNNSNVNAMVNNLLDYYVDIQERNMDKKDDLLASKKVMEEYLEKLAKRVEKCDLRELANFIKNNNANMTVFEDDIEYLLESIEDVMSGKFDGNLALDIYFDDGYYDIFASDDNKVTITQHDNDGYLVSVPMKKFLYIAYVIEGYIGKSANLYGDSRATMNDATFEKIIEDIRSIDDCAALAKKVAKTLANYEDVQDLIEE